MKVSNRLWRAMGIKVTDWHKEVPLVNKTITLINIIVFVGIIYRYLVHDASYFVTIGNIIFQIIIKLLNLATLPFMSLQIALIIGFIFWTLHTDVKTVLEGSSAELVIYQFLILFVFGIFILLFPM
jgi:hypothetical protein